MRKNPKRVLAFLSGFAFSYLLGICYLFFGFFVFILLLLPVLYLKEFSQNNRREWLLLLVCYFSGFILRAVLVIVYYMHLKMVSVSYLFGSTIVYFSAIAGPETSSQIEREVKARMNEQLSNPDYDLFDHDKPVQVNENGLKYSLGTDRDDDDGLIIYDSSNGVISNGDIIIDVRN